MKCQVHKVYPNTYRLSSTHQINNCIQHMKNMLNTLKHLLILSVHLKICFYFPCDTLVPVMEGV